MILRFHPLSYGTNWILRNLITRFHGEVTLTASWRASSNCLSWRSCRIWMDIDTGTRRQTKWLLATYTIFGLWKIRQEKIIRENWLESVFFVRMNWHYQNHEKQKPREVMKAENHAWHSVNDVMRREQSGSQHPLSVKLGQEVNRLLMPKEYMLIFLSWHEWFII